MPKPSIFVCVYVYIYIGHKFVNICDCAYIQNVEGILNHLVQHLEVSQFAQNQNKLVTESVLKFLSPDPKPADPATILSVRKSR